MKLQQAKARQLVTIVQDIGLERQHKVAKGDSQKMNLRSNTTYVETLKPSRSNTIVLF